MLLLQFGKRLLNFCEHFDKKRKNKPDFRIREYGRSRSCIQVDSNRQLFSWEEFNRS